ncbi:hypothetical protein B6U96_14155 [Archaeoglobales archaeon ex4484_92]|nr:MAG: hypothetical protein B6U96_14155 [Archaeoglobales archaeon ex4484_92]
MLICTGIMFISLFVIIYAISANQILSSFGELEKKYATKTLGRCKKILENEIIKLDVVCQDWAAWDDTYKFIDDPNQEYIQSNLVDETFEGLKLNFIVFVNKDGQVVYAKGFDYYKGEEVEVPEGLIKQLSYLSNFKETSDLRSLSIRGLITIDGRIAMISSRPIITSEFKGPIRGALIFGRFLDEREVSRLSEAAGVPIKLMNNWGLREDTIKPIDGSTLEGYAVINDVYDKPSYVLKVRIYRDIYVQGLKTVKIFILSMTAVGILFSIFAVVFIDRSVLSRLARLSDSVSKIRTHGDLKSRVPVDGNDELSKLGSEINRMLDRMESLNEQLSVLYKILRHDILNYLSVISGVLEIVKPKNQREKELIEKAVKSVERTVELIRDASELEAAIISGAELQEVNVRNIVEDVASKYDVKVDIEGNCKCLADKAIYSVFDNIISNAVIHGKTEKIDVKINGMRDKCVVKIIDYGKGIPSEIKERIFEEGFKYGENARTGLGLYIVRKVMEKYGGKVWVEDNEPTGTIFVLEFKRFSS